VRANYFDGPVAQHYDRIWAEQFDDAVVGPMVEFLAPLAGDAALEFAIGTGRIALPLAQRGIRVAGIELSPAMVGQLRAKPGAQHIDVTVGDIATTRLDASFPLVYLVANTILNLTTQADQVAVFRNAAAHLEPGGVFVIEVIVPHLRTLPPGERFQMFDATDEHVGFDEITDVVAQQAVSHHWWRGRGATSMSMPWRWVWPSELDLMAQLAGMTLRERVGDWDRRPFTGDSPKHVSVWQKAA
jgi:SAM-dependent methyltransferase